MPNVFAVPVFFICFRESLETSIIVSVLLSFLKQTLDPQADAEVRKKLVRQVWWAVASGLLICIIIGAGIIGTFYTLGRNTFESAENIWEGIFAILASVIITLISAALLRISKLQDKWRRKIRLAIEAKENQTGMWKPGFWKRDNVKRLGEKYALFILPFVTVLREGIEAVLFIAGVGVGLPAESFPLAVICGLAAGIAVGYLIYRGGTSTSLQIFLIISTCFLYLIAAGLFSRGVWLFEQNAWVKLAGEGAAEAGAGPGSYDIRKSVWHVNCCSPLENGSGGWGIFNSLFGWQNSATYGSVISYNIYWLVVIIGFLFLGIREKYGVKTSATEAAHAGEKGVGHGTGNGVREDESETSSAHKETRESKLKAGGKAGVNTRGATATEVREV